MRHRCSDVPTRTKGKPTTAARHSGAYALRIGSGEAAELGGAGHTAWLLVVWRRRVNFPATEEG